MSGNSVLDQWVEQLLNVGGDGAEVVESMRAHYKAIAGDNHKSQRANECTLRSKVSLVKRLALEAKPGPGQSNTHHDFQKGIKTLKEHHEKLLKTRGTAAKRSAEAIGKFLSMDLVTKAKEVGFCMRHSDEDPSPLCQGIAANKAAYNAFRKLRVLPKKFESFHVTPSEERACSTRAKDALLRKKKLRITSAVTLLAHTEEVLEQAQAARTKQRSGMHPPPLEVALALLLASGRRTVEVLNGRSSFEALAGTKYGCVFTGQVKAPRERRVSGFKIPLLVPFSLFDEGLAYLQEWQKTNQKGGMAKVSALSNREISVRYQSSLSKWLRVRGFSSALPKGEATAHSMRAIYMRLVLCMFQFGDGEWRDKRIAKYCLGHTSRSMSDFYDHVAFDDEGAVRKRHGGVPLRFPLSEEELAATE